MWDRLIPEETQQKSVSTDLTECLFTRDEFVTHFTIEKFDPKARYQVVKRKTYGKMKDTYVKNASVPQTQFTPIITRSLKQQSKGKNIFMEEFM